MIIDKVLGVQIVWMYQYLGISCVSRNPGAGILLNINSTSNTTAGPDTARRASCPAVINTPPTRATRVTTCQHTRGKVATIQFVSAYAEAEEKSRLQ